MRSEIDDFLRSNLLVDLYSVVLKGLRAGVESYWIKKLEPIYGFERDTRLPNANVEIADLTTGLYANCGGELRCYTTLGLFQRCL